MWESIDPDCRLYRVTDDRQTWPGVLAGVGAFFNTGGRYNRTHQATIYTALDPLVAITEAAFHQALEWQQRLSQVHVRPLSYPLLSRHILWCFTLQPPPRVIDLTHLGAQLRFPHPPHTLFNPSQLYDATRELADQVRGYRPPGGSDEPRLGGLKAPSVRVQRRGGYQPSQHVLFVLPDSVAQPWTERATLEEQWGLTMEFQTPSPRQPITFHSGVIDWAEPRFRLGRPSRASVPAFAPRPASRTFQPGHWYRLAICYT